MTAATYGYFQLKIGTNASPQVLTEIEEIVDMDGFGELAELINVSNWDTTQGQQEYIAGAFDGQQFSVTCNMVPGASTHQAALRASKGATLLFELTFLGSSPNHVWTGSVVNMGWNIDPNLDSANQIEFQFKITEAITESP